MSAPDVPAKDEAAPVPTSSEWPTGLPEQSAAEISVEITNIKASGLPAKVGFFSGAFYIRVKGGKVPQRTKTAKYVKGDEFVASWSDTVKLSGLESSKVEIEVYARRCIGSYKIIKRTESKESLADLLEHSDTPVELELLEEGQAAGKLTFRISKNSLAAESGAGDADVLAPPATTDSPISIPESEQKQDP